MVLFEKIQFILLVSMGAIIGANSRYLIYKKLEKYKIKKDIIIVFINSFASFLLGLFISVFSNISHFNYLHQVGLFIVVGYLGSLSTFSSFIYDLFELAVELKIYRALKIFIFSLLLGILFFAFGLFLGN